VAIAVIAVLSVMGLGSYRSAQKRARDAKRVQDMRGLQTAAEQYYVMSDGEYPASADISSWTINGNRTLEIFPTNPLGEDYTYTQSGDSYCACAMVEEMKASNSDASCNLGTVDGGYYCVRNRQ